MQREESLGVRNDRMLRFSARMQCPFGWPLNLGCLFFPSFLFYLFSSFSSFRILATADPSRALRQISSTFSSSLSSALRLSGRSSTSSHPLMKFIYYFVLILPNSPSIHKISGRRAARPAAYSRNNLNEKKQMKLPLDTMPSDGRHRMVRIEWLAS